MAAPAILVVDDDPNIRNVLRLYLERERYRVSEAADGPDAVELAAEGQFDLILLDVMLPGYDGMEVTRRIREFSAVPILLLTARSGDSDKVVGWTSEPTTMWSSPSARASSWPAFVPRSAATHARSRCARAGHRRTPPGPGRDSCGG